MHFTASTAACSAMRCKLAGSDSAQLQRLVTKEDPYFIKLGGFPNSNTYEL